MFCCSFASFDPCCFDQDARSFVISSGEVLPHFDLVTLWWLQGVVIGLARGVASGKVAAVGFTSDASKHLAHWSHCMGSTARARCQRFQSQEALLLVYLSLG